MIRLKFRICPPSQGGQYIYILNQLDELVKNQQKKPDKQTKQITFDQSKQNKSKRKRNKINSTKQTK